MNAPATNTSPDAEATTGAPRHALHEAFAAASRLVAHVLDGHSLSSAPAGKDAGREVSGALRAAARDFSFNALRGYGVVDQVVDALVDRPDLDVGARALVVVALAELLARPANAHTVVDQAVRACASLGIERAKGLVNAVLRNYLRRSDALLAAARATDAGRHHHPAWWVARVRDAYPADWERVLAVADQPPPMTLRVNVRRATVESCLEKLEAAGMQASAIGGSAIRLARPVPVDGIPGFREGELSVQDLGAQHAARLLDVRPGMRVLDACAAPGGKTAHLLEIADCKLIAADDDPGRARRIGENLSRLGLATEVRVHDCASPRSFRGEPPFDRILLDAPCTASGVVRRHPDIRWLRRETDIAGFARAQERLLEALWRLLAPGGTLLYVTCSVFPEENAGQVGAFLSRHPDATQLPLPGMASAQLLPGEQHDGFFHALLAKPDSPPRAG